MRNFVLTLLVFVSFGSIGQFTKEEIKSIRTQIGKGVVYKYDRVKGIIWINSKNVVIEKSSYFHLYYGLLKINGSIIRTPIRIRARLHRMGWIFANEVTIALLKHKEEDDGKIVKASYSDENPVRDVYSGGYIQEVLDGIASDDLISLLKYAIENKRMIIIRFSGDQKYTEQAMFSSRLKSLPVFFEKMNVYSEP